MKYQEQLKHPLWQKRRLEIMKLHEFACQGCGATNKTLHIHHGYYGKDMLLWEYPDDTLHCYCEDCHSKVTQDIAHLRHLMGSFSPYDIERMIGYASGILMLNSDPGENEHAEMTGYGRIVGAADFFKLSPRKIQELTDDKKRLCVHDVLACVECI